MLADYRSQVPPEKFAPCLQSFDSQIEIQVGDDEDNPLVKLNVDGNLVQAEVVIKYDLSELAGPDAFITDDTRDDNLIKQVQLGNLGSLLV